MRKLFPVLLLFAFACAGPKTKEFKINGKIIGKSSAKVYLQVYNDGVFQNLDSCDLVKGDFAFNGVVELPEYYMIKIGDVKQRIAFFVENSEITIEANIDSLNQAVVIGSQVQDKYVAYQASTKVFDDKIQKVYMDYKAAEDELLKDSLSAEFDSIDEDKSNHIKEYVKENTNCVLSPYVISRDLMHNLNLKDLEGLANVLSPDLKESVYTKKILARITVLRALQTGKEAPLFTQNDTSGNPINLADFKGQYVLVDFWASWCGPCRRANPTVVKVYKKYGSKGFAILGVSMDSNKDKWLEAIQADGLTWTHVSTLQGWANPAGKLYGVSLIPHAVLIDKEGKIVKRGIHPNELDELLGKFLNESN